MYCQICRISTSTKKLVDMRLMGGRSLSIRCLGGNLVSFLLKLKKYWHKGVRILILIFSRFFSWLHLISGFLRHTDFSDLLERLRRKIFNREVGSINHFWGNGQYFLAPVQLNLKWWSATFIVECKILTWLIKSRWGLCDSRWLGSVKRSF